MADLGPALVAGGAAIVGVVSGAGLTYWFGALTRRRQEEREDKTRWYAERFKAYEEFTVAASHVAGTAFAGRPHHDLSYIFRFMETLGAIGLVASEEVDIAVNGVSGVVMAAFKDGDYDRDRYMAALEAFTVAARADLGFPPFTATQNARDLGSAGGARSYPGEQ